MARLNLKTLVFLLIAMVGCTLMTYMFKCSHAVSNHASSYRDEAGFKTKGKYRSYEELDCSINGQYHVSCRKEGKEVFLPFTFLEKYYDVYGKLATNSKGREHFEWSHSYSRVYRPAAKYDSSGIFMYFDKYNVEIRDRVKCVSALIDVMNYCYYFFIFRNHHFYAVQVAQYGLSHYSKNLSEPPPKKTIFEDGNTLLGKFQIPSGGFVRRNFDEELNSHVVDFNSRDLVFGIDILFQGTNGSLTIFLEDRDRSLVYPISFTCSSILIDVQQNSSNQILYGMGPCGKWTRLTRDLFIDLVKGHAISGRGEKVSRTKLRVLYMTLKGNGRLDNITMSSSDHIGMFYSSASWLVRHQDGKGGWPISVKRKIASGRADLAPGWYSAMGQGQAMSLLMRAYFRSGQRQYLEAAINGMKPFSVPSSEGGVRAYFLNQYPFYEEYPTIPPSFVLNGFIYSLIGLYDVMSLAPKESAGDAQLLFDQGMQTLKKLLPLYDTGSGSVYDLRHFTLGLAPNIARWSYHSTHINQLHLLSTIDSDSILSSVAERWTGYMQGKRAAHN
uniref:heparosan-N-sulfate-glucuronate 5-epimerase n=1 Tax=Eubosmina coregoni TaxID=186181 RepID=A0A4Y7LNB2_9CRUS|nr:EOG090X0272 [Eubosmina coregoni]SVE69666.1 EOG090X0272 [Eubosmina coregoni]